MDRVDGVESWLARLVAPQVTHLSRCKKWRAAFGQSNGGRRDSPHLWASVKCIASKVLSSRAWKAFVPRLLKRSSPKSYFINL